MRLRDYITEIATTYDRRAGTGTPTQRLIRRARHEVGEYAPIGISTVGKAGSGGAATIPWFGFLDPEETTSPHEGLYVVYLFTADLRGVWLTLIQGVTNLYQLVRPPAAARERLRQDGEQIRSQLGAERLRSFRRAIELRASGQLPAGYEAGAVAAIQYAAADLPAEEVLRADLQRMFAPYQDAIAAKRVLLTTQPGSISTPSGASEGSQLDESLFDHLKPKSSGDYETHVVGGTFKRMRRHEALIADYGAWARARGSRLRRLSIRRISSYGEALPSGLSKARFSAVGTRRTQSARPLASSSSIGASSIPTWAVRRRRLSVSSVSR